MYSSASKSESVRILDDQQSFGFKQFGYRTMAKIRMFSAVQTSKNQNNRFFGYKTSPKLVCRLICCIRNRFGISFIQFLDVLSHLSCLDQTEPFFKAQRLKSAHAEIRTFGFWRCTCFFFHSTLKTFKLLKFMQTPLHVNFSLDFVFSQPFADSTP